MTPEQISKWAREAGIYLDGENQQQPLYVAKEEELQAFATLVRNATIEDCAVKCAEHAHCPGHIGATARALQKEIRSLKS